MRSDLLQRKFILATFVILKTNSSVDGWDSAGGDRISTKTNSSDNNRESAGGSPTSYMPELPEVETIRRQLFKEVTGKRIKSVEIKLPKMVYFDGRRSDVKNFKKSLEGARITKADRAAKILIIELSNGYTLLIHLKLTGQLIYRARDGKINRGGHGWPPNSVPVPNKWTHMVIHFTDDSKLYFNDLRQFGYLKLIETKKVGEQKELKKLGPEPLDKNFTAEKFSEMLARRPKAKIKPLLLDQNFLSGVGNIYADESLFYAGVLPTRPAGELKPTEIRKLYQGIKTIRSEEH